MKELYEGVAEILEIAPATVNSSLSLVDYAWDSLAIVSTMALVDDLYGVVLDGKSLLSCKTVADIEGLIASKRGS